MLKYYAKNFKCKTFSVNKSSMANIYVLILNFTFHFLLLIIYFNCYTLYWYYLTYLVVNKKYKIMQKNNLGGMNSIMA